MKANHYIKNQEQLKDYQCSFCFEVYEQVLQCRGGCFKRFCKKCARDIIHNSNNCPYCYTTFKPQYLPVKSIIFYCPSLNPTCEFQINSEIQFLNHSKQCQYVSQQLKAQFKFKSDFRCPLGHLLRFPLGIQRCDRCYDFNYCSRCVFCKDKRYCMDCIKLPCSKKLCPLNHDLVEGRDGGSITCDLCGLRPYSIGNTRIYSDRNCNFDVCQACHGKLPVQHPFPNYCRQIEKTINFIRQNVDQ